MRRWVEDEEDCPLEEKGECEALSWDTHKQKSYLTGYPSDSSFSVIGSSKSFLRFPPG